MALRRDVGIGALKGRTALRRNIIVASVFLCLVVLAVLWSIGRQTDRSPQLLAAQVSEIHRPRPSDEIACADFWRNGPPLVILALGQSNAGNHGGVPGSSPRGALWFEARCYPLADPLAGATGTDGSIWSRLAAAIAPRLGSRELVVAVLAVDTTRVSEWTGEGPLTDRLERLMESLRENHVTVSAVLWQQGEADARAGTGADDYAAALGALIERLRRGGISAPLLLARSTRCRNTGSDEIRKGVSLAASRNANVILGPDTDALGDALRSDGCHFNEEGLARAADAWVEALSQRGFVPRPLPPS